MNNLYKGYIGRLSVVFTLFVALITTGQLNAQPGEPTRGFEEVADNLYRVQNNNHYTMVLITDEGAIITDPINSCLLYTSPSPRDQRGSRMPSSA